MFKETINHMTNPVLDRFKDNFKDLTKTDWSQLDKIYADNILFKDPVHEVNGLVAVEDYFSNMSAGLIECRFEYLDQVTSDSTAYLKWVMHFKHPRLGKDVIDVRGVTHVCFNEKIGDNSSATRSLLVTCFTDKKESADTCSVKSLDFSKKAPSFSNTQSCFLKMLAGLSVTKYFWLLRWSE